jgi:hypothetical protein
VLSAGGDETIGVVVGVEGSAVRVATSRGAVFATASQGVAIGSRVRVRAGVASLAPAAVKVYQV